MSYIPGEGVDASIGLNVGYKEDVDLSARRADDCADLSIGRSVATITLQPNHLEVLRDLIPQVLADLGVLDAAEERAVEAGSRAETLEKYLQDQADTADAAGKLERAGELRGTADKLRAATDALHLALEALTTAALAADDASERAKQLLDEQVAREQSTGGDAPGLSGG